MQAPSEAAVTLAEQEEKTSFEELELQRLENELERIRKGIQRYLNLLADCDKFLIDEYKGKLREFKEQEQQMLAQKEELQQALQLQSQNELSLNLLQDAVEYYQTLNPDEITFEQKQELIRKLIREIRVFKDGTVQILTF